jgi:putative hydrolase of the HAD superfamily
LPLTTRIPNPRTPEPPSPRKRGALWWDFDGTLVSRPMMWSEVAMRRLDRYWPGHTVTRAVMDAQVSLGMPWHRADHAHPELSSPALWWEAVYRRYVEIFDALGVPAAADSAAFAELRSDILNPARYRVFDDVVPALSRAAANGWRNLIVSNHVPELESLVDDLGLTSFFESTVGSAVVGYEKPHRLLFEEALRRTGASRPIWMIGDNASADCAPVCAMGNNAVLVRSTAIGTFEQRADDLLGALDLIDAVPTEC